MTARSLDQTIRTRTAFASFDELVNKTHPSYRPSIEVRTPEMVELADAYDAAMEKRGDPRRAYRYGEPPAPAERAGTTIINGFHVTLRFSDDGGERRSECWVSRGRESSSLALVMDMGGIDGDARFILVPESVIDRIVKWALARGY